MLLSTSHFDHLHLASGRMIKDIMTYPIDTKYGYKYIIERHGRTYDVFYLDEGARTKILVASECEDLQEAKMKYLGHHWHHLHEMIQKGEFLQDV